MMFKFTKNMDVAEQLLDQADTCFQMVVAL